MEPAEGLFIITDPAATRKINDNLKKKQPDAQSPDLPMTHVKTGESVTCFKDITSASIECVVRVNTRTGQAVKPMDVAPTGSTGTSTGTDVGTGTSSSVTYVGPVTDEPHKKSAFGKFIDKINPFKKKPASSSSGSAQQ